MELVVKVGNKPSKLKFNNYRAIRALDINDVKDAVETSNCHVLVIEKIKEEEKSDFETFISEFIKVENNKVLYFMDSEDDPITMGLADEFEHDVYFDDTIYGVLSFLLNRDISPKMDTNALEKYSIEHCVGDVQTTEDEDSTDESDVEEIAYSDNITITNDNDIIGIDETEDAPTKEINDENDVDTSKASDYIENTGSADTELQDKYNKAIEDIKKAYGRIDSLEKVITTINKEKKTIEDKFKDILISESEVKVIERNAISIDDFNSLKALNEQLNSSIEAITRELEDAKNDNDNLTSTLTNLKQDKKDLTEDNEKLNNKIVELNAQVENLKTDNETITYKNNELEALNKELSEDNKDNDDIRKELSEKKIKINELTDENESLQSSLDQEIIYREKTDDLIRERTTVLIDVLTRIEELERLNKQLTDINTNYKDNINKLETNLGSIDTSESVALKAQLDLVNEQLANKTKEYNDLISMIGSDEKGVERMISRTEQVESMNEKLTKENKELENSLANITGERDRLQTEIKLIKAKFGDVKEQTTKAITYEPKARFISLIGYGSTGVTTTAVSLAYKLYSTSTVLIVDWDLINPKMNQWVGINEIPLCKINGFNDRDIRTTSLGMFYSSGIDVCKNNISKLIKNIQTTKGGRVDYFGGLYYNIENSELVNANYNALLKLIDSLGYEYVIIDFGRLGTDRSFTDIIKGICNISYKVIGVVDNDPNDINNFKTRLRFAKFDLGNIHWFINKCSNKSESDLLSRKIGGKATTMMFESELINKRTCFNTIMSTRTKFNNEIALQLLEL